MFGELGKMAALMKNLQGLKENMEKMKAEMAEREYAASSCGSQVTAVVSGDLVLKQLLISPEIMKTGDTALLRDAVVEAVNSAITQAKIDAASRLSDAAGGMNVPGFPS